jgi:hypothetical protein
MSMNEDHFERIAAVIDGNGTPDVRDLQALLAELRSLRVQNETLRNTARVTQKALDDLLSAFGSNSVYALRLRKALHEALDGWDGEAANEGQRPQTMCTCDSALSLDRGSSRIV